MTGNNLFHLFVYGSLRSGFHSPAYEYISRYFNLVGDAKVKGRLFDMGEYPAAVPVEEDVFIHGELYVIKSQPEFSWAIGQLDDYEGISTEPGEPVLYYRGEAPVFISDQAITAWIYWYKGDVSGRPEIASGDLMEYIRIKNK
jgi:gamma-glutamylcyclotransferase (GGCT)/AIG2-like uncharacterized protein YtfP